MAHHLEKLFLEGLATHQDKLFRICTAYTANREEARDLFQDVLVQIWQSMESFNHNAAIGTWMYRITLNNCLQYNATSAKSKKFFVKLNATHLEQKENLADNQRQEQLALLYRCIKKLNEADRSVITLFLEDLAYKQIAEITGLTENTVAVKIKRIKTKLFNCINSLK